MAARNRAQETVLLPKTITCIQISASVMDGAVKSPPVSIKVKRIAKIKKEIIKNLVLIII